MATKKKAAKDGEEKKGGLVTKLKPVLMIVAAVAGYKFFLAPKPVATPTEVSAAAVAEPAEGAIVTMPELVLNLAGPKQTYLRVGAALVLEKGVDAEALKEEVPLASDVLVDVLSAKTPEELKDPAAKLELKKELSEKVRHAFHDEKVLRVIFTTFVMQ
ncbi:MAG: flagellar basal body-associated FliL family protein [Acidimicrobiales bacterium]